MLSDQVKKLMASLLLCRVTSSWWAFVTTRMRKQMSSSSAIPNLYLVWVSAPVHLQTQHIALLGCL